MEFGARADRRRTTPTRASMRCCGASALTGVPVLVNTSFNVRGEPIVCTPRDAIDAFYCTPLDALAIGSFILEKASSA